MLPSFTFSAELKTNSKREKAWEIVTEEYVLYIPNETLNFSRRNLWKRKRRVK